MRHLAAWGLQRNEEDAALGDERRDGVVMIQGMFDYGSMQALERTLQFTGERHKLLTHNIANLNTPHFRPRDLDPAAFQQALGDALAERRSNPNPVRGELEIDSTWHMRFEEGRIDVDPPHADQNIMFHDRNNRDLDRTMQSLAENTLVHNAAVEMLRNQFDMLKLAIRERI